MSDINSKKMKLIRAGAVIGLAMLLSLLSASPFRARLVSMGRGAPINVPGLNQGCSVYFRRHPEILYPPASETFLQCGLASERKIHGLDGLAGHVTLNNERQALDYVRLLTSMTMDLMSFRSDLGREVMTKDTEETSEHYGLREVVKGGDGFCGVISAEAFKLGKFTPPEVQIEQGDFVISRWIFDNEQNVKLVQERVGVNGSYAVHTLKTGKAPSLPDTRWGHMRYM